MTTSVSFSCVFSSASQPSSSGPTHTAWPIRFQSEKMSWYELSKAPDRDESGAALRGEGSHVTANKNTLQVRCRGKRRSSSRAGQPRGRHARRHRADCAQGQETSNSSKPFAERKNWAAPAHDEHRPSRRQLRVQRRRSKIGSFRRITGTLYLAGEGMFQPPLEFTQPKTFSSHLTHSDPA